MCVERSFNGSCVEKFIAEALVMANAQKLGDATTASIVRCYSSIVKKGTSCLPSIAEMNELVCAVEEEEGGREEEEVTVQNDVGATTVPEAAAGAEVPPDVGFPPPPSENATLVRRTTNTALGKTLAIE